MGCRDKPPTYHSSRHKSHLPKSRGPSFLPSLEPKKSQIPSRLEHNGRADRKDPVFASG